jgi:hypothetical protein
MHKLASHNSPRAITHVEGIHIIAPGGATMYARTDSRVMRIVRTEAMTVDAKAMNAARREPMAPTHDAIANSTIGPA